MCATEIQGIVDLSEPMNSDSDAKYENETLIKTATFSNALHCMETVKTYLVQQVVNDTVSYSLLKSRKKNSFESGLLSSQEKGAKAVFAICTRA
ncbi:hypothetical protein TNCV_1786171 [Trichonephila clavipes]|nr:hypothetical protein TNCV_1786171 [Trichonephila clavipes]